MKFLMLLYEIVMLAYKIPKLKHWPQCRRVSTKGLMLFLQKDAYISIKAFQPTLFNKKLWLIKQQQLLSTSINLGYAYCTCIVFIRSKAYNIQTMDGLINCIIQTAVPMSHSSLTQLFHHQLKVGKLSKCILVLG